MGGRARLSDTLAERLRERILSGALRPGERLPSERELASELRVNRGSLREALVKLEQARLVRIERGSGIRVCDPGRAAFELLREALAREGAADRARLADLLELRALLASGALRLALERGTRRECDAAAARLERAADAGAGDGLDPIVQALAAMSKNRALALVADALAGLGPEPDGLPGPAPAGAGQRLRPALQRLALALRARDPVTAERALRECLDLQGIQAQRNASAASSEPRGSAARYSAEES